MVESEATKRREVSLAKKPGITILYVYYWSYRLCLLSWLLWRHHPWHFSGWKVLLYLIQMCWVYGKYGYFNHERFLVKYIASMSIALKWHPAGNFGLKQGKPICVLCMFLTCVDIVLIAMFPIPSYWIYKSACTSHSITYKLIHH